MASCPLDDLTLESILSGEASPATSAHVRQCSVCHIRLTELAREEYPFKKLLFRAACPSPEELAKWHMGWLESDVAECIASHVDRCANCRNEVKAQAEILDLPVDGEAEVMQDRKRVVAQPIDQMHPTTRALRGPATCTGQRYRAEDVTVVIDLEQHSSVRYNIVGLIEDDVTRIGQFDGASVVLWKDQQYCGTVQVDDLDTFAFSNVVPDTYSVEIHFNSKTVVIEELDIH